MKLTEAKLKKLIKEAMEEDGGVGFDEKLIEMISKDLDFEGLRWIVDTLLDDKEIEYERKDVDSAGWASGTRYIFKQPKGHMSLPYYWYMPFEELVDALSAAGIRNEDKTRISIMSRLSKTSPSFRTQKPNDKRILILYDNS